MLVFSHIISSERRSLSPVVFTSESYNACSNIPMPLRRIHHRLCHLDSFWRCQAEQTCHTVRNFRNEMQLLASVHRHFVLKTFFLFLLLLDLLLTPKMFRMPLFPVVHRRWWNPLIKRPYLFWAERGIENNFKKWVGFDVASHSEDSNDLLPLCH